MAPHTVVMAGFTRVKFAIARLDRDHEPNRVLTVGSDEQFAIEFEPAEAVALADWLLLMADAIARAPAAIEAATDVETNPTPRVIDPKAN